MSQGAENYQLLKVSLNLGHWISRQTLYHIADCKSVLLPQLRYYKWIIYYTYPYNTNVRKVAIIRNRYYQVPHLTQNTTWESDKNTIKNHKQKPRDQHDFQIFHKSIFRFCCALLCILSSFAIILKRKRELIASLSLSYGCLVTVNVL